MASCFQHINECLYVVKSQLRSHWAYLFDPDFCNRASGWEKGRVEKDVQDSRRRIWVEGKRTANPC